MNISSNSIVVAAKKQVSCDLAGEAAILNLRNGVYYGLDPVGAHIWSMIQRPSPVQEIVEMILAQYDVTAERAELDLLALLQRLAAEGLIEVADDKAT